MNSINLLEFWVKRLRVNFFLLDSVTLIFGDITASDRLFDTSNFEEKELNFSEILFLDKVFGFLFGALRGALIVVLFYLAFLYLIGKERELPDLILEAYPDISLSEDPAITFHFHDSGSPLKVTVEDSEGKNYASDFALSSVISKNF